MTLKRGSKTIRSADRFGRFHWEAILRSSHAQFRSSTYLTSRLIVETSSLGSKSLEIAVSVSILGSKLITNEMRVSRYSDVQLQDIVPGRVAVALDDDGFTSAAIDSQGNMGGRLGSCGFLEMDKYSS